MDNHYNDSMVKFTFKHHKIWNIVYTFYKMYNIIRPFSDPIKDYLMKKNMNYATMVPTEIVAYLITPL